MTHLTQENYADPLDRASELEMISTADAIREVQKRMEQKQKPDFEGRYAITECESCGDDIPEERLRIASNNLCCTICASKAERRR